MSRLLYLGIVLGIVAYVVFIFSQALSDPVAFAANRDSYLMWAMVVAAVTVVVACASTGRWLMLGVACLAVGAWYRFNLDGGRLLRLAR